MFWLKSGILRRQQSYEKHSCNESGQGARAQTSYRADHGYYTGSFGGTTNMAHREDVVHNVDLLIAIDDWLAVLLFGCGVPLLTTPLISPLARFGLSFLDSSIQLRDLTGAMSTANTDLATLN